MLRHLLKFFTSGHERSLRAKKHIVASIGLRAISMACSFLMVPLLIDYLNPTRYGIWLTLASVISWMGFFDIGLGNGLRNRFAEAKANNKHLLAKTYVSTTYGILTIIAGILFLLFLGFHFLADWKVVLNAPESLAGEVSSLAFIVFSIFCFQFVVRLINTILTADQKPALSQAINTIVSVISLAGVFLISRLTKGSLVYVGAIISAVSLLIPFIVSIWYYNEKYRLYRPSLKHVDFKYSKDLLGLGIQFFIMQGAAMIVFATDNMIITQLLGPEHVTPYNIAFRYFNLVAVFFAIITSPFWSAFTEAYNKDDFEWIRRITRKVMRFWILTAVMVVVLLFLSDVFYKLWLGKQYEKVVIPFTLSALMALWALMRTGVDIFSNFLSGVSKIRLSLYHAIFVSIVNIPLSILFADTFSLGSPGVILASCVCIFPRIIIQPLQYFKIVRKKAKGIWDK